MDNLITGMGGWGKEAVSGRWREETDLGEREQLKEG